MFVRLKGMILFFFPSMNVLLEFFRGWMEGFFFVLGCTVEVLRGIYLEFLSRTLLIRKVSVRLS